MHRVVQVQLRLLDGVYALRWRLTGARAEQGDHRQDVLDPLCCVREVERPAVKALDEAQLALARVEVKVCGRQVLGHPLAGAVKQRGGPRQPVWRVLAVDPQRRT